MPSVVPASVAACTVSSSLDSYICNDSGLKSADDGKPLHLFTLGVSLPFLLFICQILQLPDHNMHPC